MRKPDSPYYYAASEYEGPLCLADKPAFRPPADIILWLKHTALLLGRGWLGWLGAVLLVSACCVLFAGAATLLSARLSAAMLEDGYGKTAVAALRLARLLFVSMLPLLFAGGLVSAAAALAEGGGFQTGRLFDGFLRFGRLAGFFCCWLLPMTLIYIAVPEGVPAAGVLLLLASGCWFALPLMMQAGVPPLRAVGMSLWGCLKNILPVACCPAAAWGGYHALVPLVPDGWRDMLRAAFAAGAPFPPSDPGVWALLLLCWFAAVPAMVFLPVAGYVSYRNVWTNISLR